MLILVNKFEKYFEKIYKLSVSILLTSKGIPESYKMMDPKVGQIDLNPEVSQTILLILSKLATKDAIKLVKMIEN